MIILILFLFLLFLNLRMTHVMPALLVICQKRTGPFEIGASDKQRARRPGVHAQISR